MFGTAKRRDEGGRVRKSSEKERERERGEERANHGDVSHAREHMLGGGALRWRSALERTGQDGGRAATKNDGEKRK